MALLWVDGFEGYGTSGNPSPTGILSRRYTVNEPDYLFMVTGRTGTGYALHFNGTSPTEPYIQTPSLTTDDTIIISFAFYMVEIANKDLVSLYDDTTKGISIRILTTGELAIYRGTTLIATTSGLNLTTGQWYYIQFKVKCHDTTGTYELKYGETTVLSDTEVDTKAGSHDYHNRVRFEKIQYASNYFYIDDFAVCDSTGTKNNDFPGNCKIVMISPDEDDTANWSTVSPGPNHYEAVDETIVDNDTTYIEETTANTLDLYGYAALSGLGTIKGLQINTDCRETDATSYSLITPVKSGSTQSDDSPQAIGSTNYQTMMRISETDPNTSNLWTESGINAAKFGVKVG